MKDTMKAYVKGHTCDGDPFEEELTFRMLKTDSPYGTGYYMRVEMSISGPQLEDVRYTKTTDIETLADRFIEGWYGKNAESVRKE